MYYPSSENKGADQLRGYREADLRLCFRLCRLLVFPRGGSIIDVLMIVSDMTVLTAGTCAVVINSAGSAIPAAVGSAIGITLTGLHCLVKGNAVGAALGGAVGAATSAGAITGAMVTKTVASALTGGLVGGMSAAGTGSVVAGSLGGAAEGMIASPIGMLCVGTSVKASRDGVTYDCWKPVLHDTSEEESDGMLLKDLCQHPNVINCTVEVGTILPHIVIENMWFEKFEIEYLVISGSDRLLCHANRIS